MVQLRKFVHNTALIDVPRNIPEHEGDHFSKWRKGSETQKEKSIMVLEECTHGDLFDFIST